MISDIMQKIIVMMNAIIIMNMDAIIIINMDATQAKDADAKNHGEVRAHPSAGDCPML